MKTRTVMTCPARSPLGSHVLLTINFRLSVIYEKLYYPGDQSEQDIIDINTLLKDIPKNNNLPVFVILNNSHKAINKFSFAF